MKTRTSYVCQQCGYNSGQWLGKCPGCDSWNSLVETIESFKYAKTQRLKERSGVSTNPIKLSEVIKKDTKRVSCGVGEFDRVLGGGIVPGQVVLLAGEPGIGKSTLLLELVARLGGLYVSGEESPQQVKIRADRLEISSEKISILPETDVDNICVQIETARPNLVIIDSIQTITTEDLTGIAGAVGQVRESAFRLVRTAKSLNIPLFIVGHVTKEGTIAGPKVLEHTVDTVLQLEGEKGLQLRILRSNKNRFGPTDEIGIFEMADLGMKEVKNPSEIFIGESPSGEKAGSVIVATLEGTRPLLVEVQALVVSTPLQIPRRVVNGVDYNRVQLILGVLQKHLRLPLATFDIYVNVSGGIKIDTPAADLGIALAIISSFKNIPLAKKTVAIGEIGLLGEVRRVLGLKLMEKESKRLGYPHLVTPESYPSLVAINAKFFKTS